MIEYTVRNTESGNERSGRAKAILLLTGGEEPDESTKEQMEREGTDTLNGVLYFGTTGSAGSMGDALASSALQKDASPMRTVIVSIDKKLKEREYGREFTGQIIKDLAIRLMEKIGVNPDENDDEEKWLRENGIGGIDDAEK